MAIVKSLPGFEVTIVANGKPLTEHVDSSEPDEDRKTTRYIEAVSDQVFEIHVKASKGAQIQGDALLSYIYIDGKYVSGIFLEKGTNESHDRVGVKKGARESLNTIREFCFASLESAQDRRAFHGEQEKLSQLGTIRVRLDFIRKLGTQTPEYKPKEVKDLGIVSEKALALQDRPLSHSVGYKSSLEYEKGPSWKTERVDPSGNSACNVIFHYASKTSLQYASIIPRTPSPPPLEDKEELTLEEVKQLQAEMRERKRKERDLMKIKKEQEEEVNPKRRKTAQPKAGDTQLALDEGGDFAQQSTAHLGSEKQAPIELSSGEEDSDED